MIEAIYLRPKWVTVNDFNNYWGEDLRSLLGDASENNSNYPEVFLARVEDKITNWIDNNTFRIVPFNKLRGNRLAMFQKAILEQAMYIIKEGEIGLDSGYDREKGKVLNFEEIEKISVCNSAIDYLQNAGLLNLTMKNRPRFMHGGYEISTEYQSTFPDGGGYDPGRVAPPENNCPTPTPTPTPTPCPSNVITGIAFEEVEHNLDQEKEKK